MARIALIYPPIAQPFSPSLAVAELASIIKIAGHTPLTFDLNIKAHIDLLNKSYITKTLLNLETELEKLEQKNSIRGKSILRYNTIIRALTQGPVIAERIEKTIKFLRQIDNYRLDGYNQEYLKKEWKLFDAARDLLFQTLDRSIYDNAFCFLNVKSIMKAVQQPEITPFDQVFNTYSQEIKANNPDAIGINITFPEQMVPAFILSKKLKKKINCPILMGGSLLSLLSKEIKQLPQIFEYVDGICVGDGEHTLLDIAEGNDLENIPNLLVLNKLGEVFYTGTKSWDICSSGVPLFDNDSLSLLFTPQPIVPYQTVRSCYYGKCNFCNYTKVNRQLRERSVAQIVSDLQHIAENNNTDTISFADDATSPHRLRTISEEIISRNLKILWWTCTRFDGSWNQDMLNTLEAAGCARLFFGFESAVPRVQKTLANKGFNLDKVKKVLSLIKKTSIHPHVSAIVGFPTETFEEATQTVAFMKALSKNPRITTRIHLFRLAKDSPFALSVENNKKEFGILKIKRAELDTLAIQYSNYCVASGMEKEKAIALVNEFDEFKEGLPKKCYGENHTFEPLIWAKKHSRELPPSDYPEFEHKILLGPKLRSTVILKSFSFSPQEVKFLSEGIYKKAEDLLYSGLIPDWENALQSSGEMSEKLLRQNQLVIYDILTDNLGVFPCKFLSFFKLLNGINRLETLLTQWIDDRLGSDSQFKTFIDELKTNGFIY